MRKITLFKLLLLTFAFAISGHAVGQTNPTAQLIPYSQNFDGLAHSATAYPDGIQGWTIGTTASLNYRTTAPTANATLTASSTASTNSGGVHNFSGKIGFLQTGSTDPAICLSLITTGKSNIVVTYDAMTIRNPWDGTTANNRINELSLQYRIGTSGAFTDVFGVEYRNIGTGQTTAVTTPQNLQTKSITLPAECDNQSEVQIRWVAKDVSGAGSRPSFAIDNISVDEATFTNFYSKSTGNLNDVANWGTNTDGSGTNPTNFTADYQMFNIQNNATPTIGATWVVSGKGSKVIVGNGTDATTFTIPSGFVANAVIDVANNATLRMQNTTLPSIANIAIGSTIEFGQSAGLTILDRNYPSNLIFSGAGTKTWSPGANRTLTGNLIINEGIFAFGNGVTLTISGNISVASTGTIAPGSSANRFVASGANRTFTLNGTARVTSNESQTAAATTPFSYQYNGFATYTFAPTSWVSFRSPTTTAVTQGIDGITGSPFGNVEIAAITNLTAAGSNTHTFKTNVDIAGILAFPRLGANTSLIINFGANTVKVGGAIQLNGSNTSTQTGGRTYNMGTSTLELNGTVAQNTLGGTDLPNTFNNLTINNAAGVTPQSAVTVNGTLTLTNGKITLGNNNLTVGTFSGGSATSYVVTNGTGKVTIGAAAATKVTLPIGTTTEYHEVSLTPTDATSFTASVINGVPEAAPSNIRLSDYTWIITSTTPSVTEIELTPATAVSNGISSFIASWNGTAYDYQTAIRTTNTYKANFGTFASFVVGETDNTTNNIDLSDKINIYTFESAIKVDGIANGAVIRIRSINGQTIATHIANSTSNSFTLKSGIYIVTVGVNENMITKKVIVK